MVIINFVVIKYEILELKCKFSIMFWSFQFPQIWFYGFCMLIEQFGRFCEIWRPFFKILAIFNTWLQVLYLMVKCHITSCSSLVNLQIFYFMVFTIRPISWNLAIVSPKIGEFYTWQPLLRLKEPKGVGWPWSNIDSKIGPKTPMTRPRKVKVIISIKRDWGKIRVRLRKD